MATVKVRLSGTGARQIAKTLAQAFSDYEEQINVDTADFVNELARTGAKAGESVVQASKYAGDIDFTVEQDSGTGQQHTATLTASAEDKEVHWYTSAKRTERRSEMINPLLMAEFGSGFENIVSNPMSEGFVDEAVQMGMKQGSLEPNYGHAKDVDGWGYFDDSGTLHITRGEPPTAPVFNALLAMQEKKNIESAKQKAF